MGTRGFFGFKVDEQFKVTYNHFDSYPSGLGETVLQFCRNVGSWGAVRALAERIEVVDEQATPTQEHIDICTAAGTVNLNVSNQSVTDYYCLLREAQGDPEAYLKIGIMADGVGFGFDSLFCEWGYLIDLDRDVLQVYAGFQTDPHQSGFWADGTIPVPGPSEHEGVVSRAGTEYKPVRLVREYAFDLLPETFSDSDEDDLPPSTFGKVIVADAIEKGE